MENMFEKEPYFVNQDGVKWWKDEDSTKYAQTPDIHGTILDVNCFYIEQPSGRRSRVLISKSGKIIDEDQSLNGISIKIDMRKFKKRNHKKYNFSKNRRK